MVTIGDDGVRLLGEALVEELLPESVGLEELLVAKGKAIGTARAGVGHQAEPCR